MAKKYYYLASLILILVVPSVIESIFILGTVSVPHLLAFVSLATITGTLWDIWGTQHGKRDPVWLWAFNKRETLGIKFLGLPIEEYLFYIAGSTYVIFSWEIIQHVGESGNDGYYFLLMALALWSVASIAILLNLTVKQDKFAE